MDYTTVLSLADAKNYLRVDTASPAEDDQITGFINAAFSYIEKDTNVYVIARDITYILVNGCKRVYDAPINSVVSPPAEDLLIKTNTLYTTYQVTTSDDQNLVLNVGYELPADVPPELITVAYEMIELQYEGKSITTGLSETSRQFLGINKRFVL